MPILYNLLMAGVDAATLRWLGLQRTRGTALLGILVIGGTGVFLALAFGGGSLFATGRLLAYGLFIHGFIALAGGAILHRRHHRGFALLAGLLAVSLEWIAADAFLVEPHRLEISTVRVESPKLSRPVRLLLLADFQTDAIGDYERDVFRRIMELKPDLILMAGDYLQVNPRAEHRLREELRALLREVGFSAPLGIVAVTGDVDDADWPEMFDGFPVTATPRTRTIPLGELSITALSLEDSINPRLSVPRRNGFHIVLGHRPDFALGDVKGDLLVAGHTHGGQVRLPGIGALITFSQVPRRWASGVTPLSDGRTLVVSRGVGMERGAAPRLRFLCRPELVVVDLLPPEHR